MILKLKEKENNKEDIDKININKEKLEYLEDKLVNFMILKRAKENLIELEKEKKEKKLIII